MFSIALPACRFVTGWHSARAEAPLEAGTSPVAFVCIQLLAGSAGEKGGGTAELGGSSDGPLFPGAASYRGEVPVPASLSCNCDGLFARLLGEGEMKGWAPFPSWNSTGPSAS